MATPTAWEFWFQFPQAVNLCRLGSCSVLRCPSLAIYYTTVVITWLALPGTAIRTSISGVMATPTAWEFWFQFPAGCQHLSSWQLLCPEMSAVTAWFVYCGHAYEQASMSACRWQRCWSRRHQRRSWNRRLNEGIKSELRCQLTDQPSGAEFVCLMVSFVSWEMYE